MPLPDSYAIKLTGIPAYFDAMLDAEPPERFSVKFLENLGFTSTNDRLFIGILKELGFLNRDGAPQPRYYEFLDRTNSKRIVAQSIREAFSDLFAVNKKINEAPLDEVRNKLKTLYAGKKTNLVIGNIAKTFKALCDYADFSAPSPSILPLPAEKSEPAQTEIENTKKQSASREVLGERLRAEGQPIRVAALQYHVNIVLPDTRDQAVYDAIFRSLRDHLG
jgi:hypothetical protein